MKSETLKGTIMRPTVARVTRSDEGPTTGCVGRSPGGDEREMRGLSSGPHRGHTHRRDGVAMSTLAKALLAIVTLSVVAGGVGLVSTSDESPVDRSRPVIIGRVGDVDDRAR